MTNDIKSFLLRIPSRLYKKLKLESQKSKRSMNQVCSQLLSSVLEDSQDISTQPHMVPMSGDLATQLNDYIYKEIIPAFTTSLVGIILFGSAARNEMRKSSDIDILIVLKSESLLDRDSYAKLKSKKINGHPVSPLIVQYPESDNAIRSVWLEVAIDGCVLYDTEFMLSQLLIKIRDKIVSGSIQRAVSYGVPYWIHQDINTREEIQ